MQLLYQKTASEKGIYIIGACGFDSVPADMGVLFTKNKFNGEVNTVEGFIAIKPGPDVMNFYFNLHVNKFSIFHGSYHIIILQNLKFATK